MKHVLFVDDEPKVLEGLRRLLFPLRNEWHMAFAGSSAEALQILAGGPCDVLVTDMRMPGMNGLELLREVAERYPLVVRIVLTGTCEWNLALQSVVSAHQFLNKPCDAQTLKRTVDRAFALGAMLADPGLKALLSKTKSLPSIPLVYAALVEAVRDPDVSASTLGRIISKDMAMTTKVLQLVNSCLFGTRRKLTDPTQAVIHLGVDTIKALVLSLGVFGQFRHIGLSHFSVEELQAHSVRTADLARRIAESEQLPKDEIEESFLAGFLHDVGRLVMAASYPTEYDHCVASARAAGSLVVDREREIFGTTHAQVGMYLLSLWGISDAAAEVVGLHHGPRAREARSFGPLAAVHVADALDHESQDQSDAGLHLDLDYLSGLGVSERLPKWRSLNQQA